MNKRSKCPDSVQVLEPQAVEWAFIGASTLSIRDSPFPGPMSSCSGGMCVPCPFDRHPRPAVLLLYLLSVPREAVVARVQATTLHSRWPLRVDSERVRPQSVARVLASKRRTQRVAPAIFPGQFDRSLAPPSDFPRAMLPMPDWPWLCQGIRENVPMVPRPGYAGCRNVFLSPALAS